MDTIRIGWGQNYSINGCGEGTDVASNQAVEASPFFTHNFTGCALSAEWVAVKIPRQCRQSAKEIE